MESIMKLSDIKTINYFAYAHNTNTEVIKSRCPSAKFISVGVLNNFNLVLHKFADIEHDPKSKCYGVVWSISLNDLAELDKFEGLHKDYNRIPLEVTTESGLIKCMAYIMDPYFSQDGNPSLDYIKSVLLGYQEHDLPVNQLKSAIINNEKTK